MTFEEQILGKRLSPLTLLALRAAEVTFIALCLFYIGGALHDALDAH